MFQPDFPEAIVVPAHPTNFYNRPCVPKGWVLHTPEEPADQRPVTPYYFQTPGIQASTHYFVAFTGRVFQMVQEIATPIANGVKGKPYPPWASPALTLNAQTLSVEIEGYAANIDITLQSGSVQWQALVELIAERAWFHNIPLDRAHIIGHYQVSVDRSDPGARFPWAALMRDLGEMDMLKDDVAALKAALAALAVANAGSFKAIEDRLKALEAKVP